MKRTMLAILCLLLLAVPLVPHGAALSGGEICSTTCARNWQFTTSTEGWTNAGWASTEGYPTLGALRVLYGQTAVSPALASTSGAYAISLAHKFASVPYEDQDDYACVRIDDCIDFRASEIDFCSYSWSCHPLVTNQDPTQWVRVTVAVDASGTNDVWAYNAVGTVIGHATFGGTNAGDLDWTNPQTLQLTMGLGYFDDILERVG